MNSSRGAAIALSIAAICASQLVLQVAGHCACAPCLCELVSNSHVAKVARTCAEGYERAEIATNRTLQLLGSLAEGAAEDNISRCDLHGTSLRGTIEQARAGYEQVRTSSCQQLPACVCLGWGGGGGEDLPTVVPSPKGIDTPPFPVPTRLNIPPTAWSSILYELMLRVRHDIQSFICMCTPSPPLSVPHWLHPSENLG